MTATDARAPAAPRKIDTARERSARHAGIALLALAVFVTWVFGLGTEGDATFRLSRPTDRWAIGDLVLPAAPFTYAAAGLLASLLLLALAYLLGSRMLAALGIAAHIWFLSRFYHDLQLDLLEKSGMLVAAGAVLLALWWAWRRGAPEAARDG